MTDHLKSALAAADWFVNTQVRMKKPHWDANHGRQVYTYHIPTRNRVLGLSWTQGRAIITLLQAFEATGRGEYLRTAVGAAEYIKHLQILDQREARRFGAIREECPASWYVNPRDALEAGIALLLLWRLTREGEYLHRARIFGDWFINQVMAEQGGEWTPSCFHLYPADAAKASRARSFCLGGGTYFFSWLARAAGNDFYLERGFKPLVHTQLRDYTREDGVVMAKARGAGGDEDLGHHHAPGERYRGVAVNDDCLGLNLIIAYRELGEEVYLARSLAYGDWMMADPGPIPNHAAVPLRALTLLDLAAVSGESKYADFARDRLAPDFTSRQALGTGDAAVEGAFRGEDEPVEYYGPAGCSPLEFVNTRVTAYAANALFKLDGKVFGPYYSALGWDRPLPKVAAELLAPYRL